MAPIELTNLSSNWKKLQKTLQPSKTAAASPKSKAPEDTEEKNRSLKRKRLAKRSGEHSNASAKSVNSSAKGDSQNQTPTRKRQKMDEPSSIGASIKHHDTKNLSRSISMPSLKQTPLLAASKAAASVLSVLTPHPDFPDIENEGVSETALPGKYIALDCEMVGTGPEPDRDSALARVSLVNFHGHQVYDSYVQVKIPVTDYRTAVSGIEPKHLRKDYARPFDEVRSDLKILLTGRILVGHAVKNDLSALILKHDKHYIRDTSKYPKFRQMAMIPGRSPALKTLAEKLLGVEIQTGAHSSVEDARATMAIFRLEKDGFEEEVRKWYGRARIDPTGVEDDAAGGEKVQRKSKSKNKKKKRKN